MRRTLFAAAVISLVASSALFGAQVTEIPFVTLSPAVMGEGGCAIATAQGYDAFFHNPAGFSRGDGTFTLSSTSWIYARPDQLISTAFQLAVGSASPTDTYNFVSQQVTTGGFGGGSSLGIGYIGDGFALGMAFILDSSLWGPTMLGATGDLTATLGFIGGYSVPFEVMGVTVHVGADIRPMIRMHTPITNSVAVQFVTALANGGDLAAPFNSAATFYGSAIGIDLGLIAEVGWFSFGLSIRDLGGTSFTYSTNTFGSVTGTLASQGRFPTGSSVADTYVIPMDVGVGIAFHPDLGNFRYFVDPIISMDFRDLFGAIDGSAIVWTLLHAGAQIKLMNLFTFRAGLNQGYLTAGAGVKLWIFDVNMAVFTQELGLHIGDRPNAGMTFNADIRI